MGTFEDKVALVTGAASGIGLATAEKLTAEGARVVLADLNETAGKEAAERLGGDFQRLDVGDATAWAEAVSGATARYGGLDLVHLNAGVTTHPASTGAGFEPFDIAALTDESYRRIMGANVDGVVFGVRAVVPALEARGGGAIVATASAAGMIAFPPDPIYTLTKHAVVGLVRSLAPVLAPRRITLNAVCPGVVDTNILGPGMGDLARQAGLPIIAPSKIADAVADAMSSGKTGQLLLCLAGREPSHYEFAPVEGLGLPGRP